MPETTRPNWMSALRAVWHQIDERNLGLIAAGVAFFGMLAMFPGLAAVIALWGLVADPVVVDDLLTSIQSILPRDVFLLIDAQVDALITARPQTLGLTSAISILIALWSSRAGVSALMRGLNTIHGTRNRSGIRHYFMALLLTFALIVIALIALSSVVIAPVLLNFLKLGDQTAFVIDLVRWIVTISVLTVGLGLIYRFGPNRHTKPTSWITPGAILAILLWAAVSAAFSIYLSNFGNYNEVYGSIGAVIALLMWLYFSAFLILLGAALNHQLEHQSPE